ncbi:hypothetical protein O9993_14115 [Vibrio lentus]|nr:hypothetical protein [Vibrio lentus]
MVDNLVSGVFSFPQRRTQSFLRSRIIWNFAPDASNNNLSSSMRFCPTIKCLYAVTVRSTDPTSLRTTLKIAVENLLTFYRRHSVDPRVAMISYSTG